MREVATVAGIRAAERIFCAANPGVDLMRVAAAEVVRVATAMTGGPASVVVLAGPGNNAGDGLYAAAELASRGWTVSGCPVLGETHRGGLAAARAAGMRVLEDRELITALADADLVIDAILGIGGRPGLPDRLLTLAAACEDLALPVLSVDLPSGLDADSGRVWPSVRATRTVTFGAVKLCHLAQPAAQRCGQVSLAALNLQPAGSGIRALELADVVGNWPVPGPADDKYSRGVVGLDTGSARYPGAAVLSCLGALHAGAGLVRYLGPAQLGARVVDRAPSITLGEGRVQVILAGSGWGDQDDNRQRLDAHLALGVPLVLDADALGVLPEQLPAGSLLTPHAGELARLLGTDRAQVSSDPVAAARAAATRTGACVLLKGATQYAVAPDGSVLIALPGPGWTAQAGSGDTLAGICATLLAAGLPTQLAAAMAASVQALTAERHPGPLPPDELAARMPALIGELTGQADRWQDRVIHEQ